MTQPETHTLDVPGAVLHYDVRSNDVSAEPVLLLAGSPMGATGFGTLAGHFTDRTVVTFDPRGAERSKRTAGAHRRPDEQQDRLDTGVVGPDVVGQYGAGYVKRVSLGFGHTCWTRYPGRTHRIRHNRG